LDYNPHITIYKTRNRRKRQYAELQESTSDEIFLNQEHGRQSINQIQLLEMNTSPETGKYYLHGEYFLDGSQEDFMVNFNPRLVQSQDAFSDDLVEAPDLDSDIVTNLGNSSNKEEENISKITFL